MVDHHVTSLFIVIAHWKLNIFFYDSIILENYRTKTIEANGGVSDQSILWKEEWKANVKLSLTTKRIYKFHLHFSQF